MIYHKNDRINSGRDTYLTARDYLNGVLYVILGFLASVTVLSVAGAIFL